MAEYVRVAHHAVTAVPRGALDHSLRDFTNVVHVGFAVDPAWNRETSELEHCLDDITTFGGDGAHWKRGGAHANAAFQVEIGAERDARQPLGVEVRVHSPDVDEH